MMAAALECPFTMAQWKELERQAMIYKYMTASVPVPTHLLFPLPNLADSSVSATAAPSFSPHHGGVVDGGSQRLKRGVDPEVGRCRRTDGKKWRCAKDAVPDQKYCERHLNRGRPRSRKRVESSLSNNSNPHLYHSYPPRPSSAAVNTTTTIPSSITIPPPSPFLEPLPHPYHRQDPSPSLDLPTIFSAYSVKDPRNLEWVVKEGTDLSMLTSNQQWQGYHPFNHQHYQESLPGSNAHEEHSGAFPLFLTPDLLSSEKRVTSEPPIRGFIDAWSNSTSSGGDKNESSVSSSTVKLELSDLTLSMAMAGGELIDEEMCRMRMGMGMGITDSDGLEQGSSIPLPEHSRLGNHVCWAVAPAPGGPLAEVLRPSNLAGGGDSGIPASTLSSPSGVIQKPMSSVSDSSGSCSPTLATSTVREEIDFPWFSLG